MPNIQPWKWWYPLCFLSFKNYYNKSNYCHIYKVKIKITYRQFRIVDHNNHITILWWSTQNIGLCIYKIVVNWDEIFKVLYINARKKIISYCQFFFAYVIEIKWFTWKMMLKMSLIHLFACQSKFCFML